MQSFLRSRRTMTALLASALTACVTIALSSCYTSPEPRTMKIAWSPRGAEAKFHLTDRSRGTTELLTVADTGFVVLRGGRVVFVRYERIRGAWFEHVGHTPLEGAGPDRTSPWAVRQCSLVLDIPRCSSRASCLPILRPRGDSGTSTMAPSSTRAFPTTISPRCPVREARGPGMQVVRRVRIIQGMRRVRTMRAILASPLGGSACCTPGCGRRTRAESFTPTTGHCRRTGSGSRLTSTCHHRLGTRSRSASAERRIMRSSFAAPCRHRLPRRTS